MPQPEVSASISAPARPAGEKPRSSQKSASGALIRETSEDMTRVENRERVSRSRAHEIADAISRIGGSIPFAIGNALFFVGWLAANSGLTPLPRFDPYPFGGLTVVVSLEAIFLAIFVLISQNRQAHESDKRARLDLQVNVIAEREVTKLIDLVRAIHDELGLKRDHDHELEEMRETTRVEDLADAADAATDAQESDHVARESSSEEK